MRTKHYWLMLFLAVLSLWTGQASAQIVQEAGNVRFANRDIVTLRASILGQSPQDRLKNITERLNKLSGDALLQPLQSEPFSFHDKHGMVINTHQGHPLLVIFSEDIAPDGPSLSETVKETQTRLQQAMLARYQQGDTWRTLISIGLTLLASVIFITALWLLQRSGRSIFKKLDQRKASFPNTANVFNWRGLLLIAERYAVKGSGAVIAFIFSYLWLTFVLMQFPYTKPWGEQLGGSIVSLLQRLSDAILSALPDIITVIVILVITRLLNRFFNLIFDAVEKKYVTIPGLHPETIGATRRLAIVSLWLFALVVSYPYLPGSNSDAFKGVSVFFGLMVTLGSAGLVNQAMSGLVLVYSRALRRGDMVKVADVEGIVIELGALSTKIRNRLNQEITLPNSVVIGGKIVNCTHLAGGQGETISTSVTIGYDAPWRQVHAMLELAAKRTVELRQNTQPIVRQLALQDFYVQYELVTHLAEGFAPPDALSALHASIQDVFNEFGVQIMSPNFEAQPEEAVLSPKSQWYTEPAVKPETK